MDQLAAIVTENDEYIEDSKGQRRNDQEIDRGRAVEVIEEERLPCLIRIRPSLRHVPRYRRLADVEAQLQQLSMNENGGDKLVHGSGGISQPRAE